MNSATEQVASIESMFTSSLDKYALSRHEGCRLYKKKKPRKRKFSHRCGREFLTLHCLKCGHQMQILSGSRDRTCPACSYELYQRSYRRYSPLLEGQSDLKLVTLTCKPVKKQSPKIVRKIVKELVKLLHRKRYRNLWRGILGVVECKKTKSGLFYYHLHLMVAGGFVPQGLLSEDWRSVSGFPIVDVRRITRTPKRALNYVLKYIMKGSLFKKSQDRSDFKESMKRVRFVHTYGEFYNSRLYDVSPHVPYPCPVCGSKKCWVIVEFCSVVDLLEGVPYYPP